MLGLPVVEHKGLIETDFGDWDGLTFREAAERDPDLHREWLSDTSVRPPGGESFDEVRERVVAARDDLISTYGGATLLVVSHVTPIKTLVQLALDAGPSLLYRLHLDLASLSITEFYPDGEPRSGWSTTRHTFAERAPTADQPLIRSPTTGHSRRRAMSVAS